MNIFRACLLRVVPLVLVSIPLLMARAFTSTVPYKTWRVQMKNQLVRHLCDPGYYFRSCFEVNGKDCAPAVENAYEKCFAGVFHEKMIDPQNEGQKIAYTNGVCLGNLLEIKWKKIKNHSKDKCRSIEPWL